MERSLFTIAPAQGGWRLADQATVDQWYPNKLAAIFAADGIALARHRETGVPTGVKVQMTDGEWVLIGVHGKVQA